MGTLFIVATPIGNLSDISLRAIEVLQKAELIACEDTRRTGLLLKHINDQFPDSASVKRPTLLSYYEDNEFKRMPQLLTALRNGLDVVVVSDAGTPTVSDPGFKLVRECVQEGIRVVSVPGPSSVISALVSSGLPTDKFLFCGYLPKKQGNRDRFLSELKETLQHIKSTVIFFEAPHRLISSLVALQSVFGDIDVVIARELTKVYEEVLQSKISSLVSKYEKVEPKGEFVVLFNLGEQNGTKD